MPDMQVVYANSQNLYSYILKLYKGRFTGLSRQWRTRDTHKQREGNMNTIQITNENGVVNYTEAEVARFIEKSKEVDAYDQVNNQYRKEINNLRHEVRDFFSEGEWSDGETTCNKGDVNSLLERIGAAKLTTKYNGTFTITGSFSIEVEDEDEIEDIITENTEISNWSADMDVDQIEVHDVEEEN